MSLCKDLETKIVCATNEAGVRTSYVAHYEYGNDAAGNTLLAATRYTDAAGAIVDLTGLEISVGACPVAAPDIEFERLCDLAEDGTFTEFLCRTVTSFDSAGVPIDPPLLAYFELDKVTVYVPEGTVGPCPDCPPATVQGVLTAWGA